jgi:asparagine synthase (glutamine-hydrolysing)
MSAIVGLYHLDGRPVDCLDLDRMAERVAHRGPDGGAVWQDGAVGLGHRLLWTTPESLTETQPRVARGGDLVLTADARIDNRDELIAMLFPDCRVPEEISASELIQAAYERWGEACPEKLIGDFAFAIWDRRRQTLFCARDPMGVKPFYYYSRPGRLFAFGSEIKALLDLPGVPRHLNEMMVACHLVGFYEDPVATFYQEIFRLPAAQSMSVTPEGMRFHVYWSLDPTRELRLGSDAEYAAAFRELFTEAVRCRLRSAFPPSSTLSGGLDSSSISCVARDLLKADGPLPGDDRRRLHTVSAIFPGLPQEDLSRIDEREYINSVVAMGDVEPHFVRADQLSPLTEVDRVLWHEDQAFFAPNLYMHWALYGAAQRQGARIFLDGIDGDTTVSYGYGYLTELARAGRWRTLFTEITALGMRHQVSRRRILRQYCAEPLVLEPLRRVRRGWQRTVRLRQRDEAFALAGSDIDPEFARRVGVAEHTEAILAARPKQRITARTEHWSSLTCPLYPYTLELADKAAAACGIEPRYPFFDRRLMEFCLALPPTQKLSQGWSRVVLRRAMEGILPRKVQWRVDKGNLNRNFRRKLWECDREVLEDVMLREPQGLLGRYVNITALRETCGRYTANSLLPTSVALRVYSVVVLGRWLRASHVTA